jgi:hypothetical protein
MKEVFVQLASKRGFTTSTQTYRLKDLLPKPKIVSKSIKTMTGPAPSGDHRAAARNTAEISGHLVAYGFTKQLVKKPSPPLSAMEPTRRVAAPETANKAAVGEP